MKTLYEAIGGEAKVRAVKELDVWEQTRKVSCPFMIVRGLRSSRWTPEIVARIEREFPHIRWATVDSMHDIAYYAPDELVMAVRSFVAGD